MDNCSLCERNVMDIYTKYCYYHGCNKHKCANFSTDSMCDNCDQKEQEIKCGQILGGVMICLISSTILWSLFHL